MSHDLKVIGLVVEELKVEHIPKTLLLYTSVNDVLRENEGVLPGYS